MFEDEDLRMPAEDTMFFKSPAHKARFAATMQQIDKVYDGSFDVYYGSAIYILTADQGRWTKIREYVSRHGILIEKMLEEVDFSGGNAALVKLAGNLFNGNMMIDPLTLIEKLDEDNYRLALTAQKLRRYGLRVKDDGIEI